MCWSFGASAVFTVFGIIATIYLVKNGSDKALWIPLLYFTLMELLQTITYFYVDNCSSSPNQLLTYLGYLHITFQPFFINMIALHFIPKEFRDRISGFVYAICFAGAFLMLIKVYPFGWAGICKTGTDALCATNLCSVTGSWHLAWNIPLNAIANLTIIGYTFPVFILPLIYGSYRFTIYHFIFGPLLVNLLAKSPNEWPAVWCLFSIALFIVIIIKPFKKQLHVRKWFIWNYPK